MQKKIIIFGISLGLLPFYGGVWAAGESTQSADVDLDSKTEPNAPEASPEEESVLVEESQPLPVQSVPGDAAPELSADPAVNQLVELARNRINSSEWYHNRVVVPTPSNVLKEAIETASKNANRDPEVTRTMQQQVAQEVSNLASRIMDASNFGYELGESFKGVTASFSSRLRAIGDAVKKSRRNN